MALVMVMVERVEEEGVAAEGVLLTTRGAGLELGVMIGELEGVELGIMIGEVVRVCGVGVEEEGVGRGMMVVW